MNVYSLDIKWIKWDLTDYSESERRKIEKRLPSSLTGFKLYVTSFLDTLYSDRGKQLVLDNLSIRYRVKATDVLFTSVMASDGQCAATAELQEPTMCRIKLKCPYCADYDYDPGYIMVEVTNCTVRLKVDRMACNPYGDPMSEIPMGDLPDIPFQDIAFSKDSQFSYCCPGCDEKHSLVDWILAGQFHLQLPQ